MGKILLKLADINPAGKFDVEGTHFYHKGKVVMGVFSWLLFLAGLGCVVRAVLILCGEAA